MSDHQRNYWGDIKDRFGIPSLLGHCAECSTRWALWHFAECPKCYPLISTADGDKQHTK